MKRYLDSFGINKSLYVYNIIGRYIKDIRKKEVNLLFSYKLKMIVPYIGILCFFIHNNLFMI